MVEPLAPASTLFSSYVATFSGVAGREGLPAASDQATNRFHSCT